MNLAFNAYHNIDSYCLNQKFQIIFLDKNCSNSYSVITILIRKVDISSRMLNLFLNIRRVYIYRFDDFQTQFISYTVKSLLIVKVGLKKQFAQLLCEIIAIFKDSFIILSVSARKSCWFLFNFYCYSHSSVQKLNTVITWIRLWKWNLKRISWRKICIFETWKKGIVAWKYLFVFSLLSTLHVFNKSCFSEVLSDFLLHKSSLQVEHKIKIKFPYKQLFLLFHQWK